MFPTVDGFHWTPWHIGFLAVFFSVVTAIAVTLLAAARRTARDLRSGKLDGIRWQEDFHDLPARDRSCRHEFTGEFPDRRCDLAFGCDTCQTHAALLVKHPLPDSPIDETPYGLPYPAAHLYHRGHTWVRLEPDGTATIGLDPLAERLSGRPEAVHPPAVGTQLRINAPAWTVRRPGAEARILSPLEGEVVAAAPLTLRLKSPNGSFETRHLLRLHEVKPWLSRELERLQLLLSPTAPALADGGIPVADLPAAAPQADWDAIYGALFLEP